DTKSQSVDAIAQISTNKGTDHAKHEFQGVFSSQIFNFIHDASKVHQNQQTWLRWYDNKPYCIFVGDKDVPGKYVLVGYSYDQLINEWQQFHGNDKAKHKLNDKHYLDLFIYNKMHYLSNDEAKKNVLKSNLAANECYCSPVWVRVKFPDFSTGQKISKQKENVCVEFGKWKFRNDFTADAWVEHCGGAQRCWQWNICPKISIIVQTVSYALVMSNSCFCIIAV
ncbi:MAG: hypothetical protein ACPG2Y_03240, partial [Acholeplasmataceae bacterium]